MSVFDTVKKFVAGDIAHDAADSGNPVKIGGKAASSAPTAVTAADRVNAYFDYRLDDLAGAVNQHRPEGFDFIIDAVGKAGIADRVLPCLKDGGTYGTYGIDDFGKISLNPGRARGTLIVHPCSYDESETHQRVSEFVLQGKLDASLWYDVGQTYPLAAIADAYAAVRARQSPKVLVRLRG